MTTNHPEKLDEALIRPGRVDHQVAFANATQLQVKELFERMYTDDLPRTKLILSHPSSFSPNSTGTTTKKERDAFTPPLTPTKSSTNGSANGTANGTANGSTKISVIISNFKTEKMKDEELNAEELSNLAASFAEQVPDGMFSPAEIQGFLLKRKKDPRRAVMEVVTWVEGMREVKRRGGKVVTVQ
jgi:mitochondrial chaperone BCS1